MTARTTGEIVAFPISAQDRDAQQRESACTVRYFRARKELDQFPSATILEFKPRQEAA